MLLSFHHEAADVFRRAFRPHRRIDTITYLLHSTSAVTFMRGGFPGSIFRIAFEIAVGAVNCWSYVATSSCPIGLKAFGPIEPT